MNILLISSYLPYPLTSGGHVRLYNLLKHISNHHTVTLICEKRDYQTEKEIAQVEKVCKRVIAVDRKKQWTFANIVKAGFSSFPFLLIGHTNKKLADAISQVLSEETFDLIHVETFYIMQNIPKTSIPVVLVEHNIEYIVYERYRNTASLILQPILAIDIGKLRFWEQTFWKQATKLVAVSEIEKALMGRPDVSVVPNGVDTLYYSGKKKKHSGIRILFIGDFKWVQNRDSLTWILKEIWPSLQGQLALAKEEITPLLWVVGREIPDNIRLFTKDTSVVFDEKASGLETNEIFASSDILLAPLRVGGGTSYKILEAMASQIPVVTTAIGAQGLPVQHEKEVLIADTTDEIVESIISLIKTEKLAETITKNARKLVEKEYAWEIIAKKLEEVYAQAKRNQL